MKQDAFEAKALHQVELIQSYYKTWLLDYGEEAANELLIKFFALILHSPAGQYSDPEEFLDHIRDDVLVLLSNETEGEVIDVQGGAGH